MKRLERSGGCLGWLETGVAELIARAVDLGKVTAPGAKLLAVQADVVCLQGAAVVTTSSLQIGEHLRAAVDVLSGIVEVGATTETTPKLGPDLSGTNGSHMGPHILAKRTFG